MIKNILSLNLRGARADSGVSSPFFLSKPSRKGKSQMNELYTLVCRTNFLQLHLHELALDGMS